MRLGVECIHTSSLAQKSFINNLDRKRYSALPLWVFLWVCFLFVCLFVFYSTSITRPFSYLPPTHQNHYHPHRTPNPTPLHLVCTEFMQPSSQPF